MGGNIIYLGGDLGAGVGRWWQKIMFEYRSVEDRENYEKQRKQEESITLFLSWCLI